MIQEEIRAVRDEAAGRVKALEEDLAKAKSVSFQLNISPGFLRHLVFL